MTAPCGFESAILHASGADRWTDALRRHVTECDDCGQAASTAPWMTRFAKIGDREHLLPDPQIVWLKAQLLQGTTDIARVTRPMNFVQLVSHLVVAGGWAALLTWKWSLVETWLSSFTPTGLVQNVARGDALPIPFLGFVLVLATITVSLALHTILAEE